LQVQGGALVAPRRERNSFRIFPEGAFFFAYFLFERKKESKRLPPCNRLPRKYTPVGCFARTNPVTEGSGFFVKRLIVHAPGKGAFAFGHELIWPGDLPVQTGKIHKFLEVFPYDSSNGLTK
jgi:hypothetical protein